MSPSNLQRVKSCYTWLLLLLTGGDNTNTPEKSTNTVTARPKHIKDTAIPRGIIVNSENQSHNHDCKNILNSQNFVTHPFSFVLSSILWQCKIWLSGLLQILWNYCKNIRIIADPVSSLPSPCKRALAFTGVDFEFTNTHNIDEDIVFIDTPNPSTFFLFFPGIKISHFWPLSYEWSIQQFLHETWNEIEFGQKCILSIKTFKLKWSMTHRVLLQISPPVVKTDLVGRRDSTIWRCYFYWRLTGREIFSDLCFFSKFSIDLEGYHINM